MPLGSLSPCGAPPFEPTASRQDWRTRSKEQTPPRPAESSAWIEGRRRVVRNHADWRRTGFLVFRTETPPFKRLNFQNGKEVGRNGSTRDQLRLVDSRKDKAFAPITTRDGFEALALLFPFDELRPGHRRCAFTSPGLPYLDHAIRLLNRQWSEQHSVDDAEDGRVRPDAQGERDHGHGGEAGLLQQLAEGVAKVVKHSKGGP